MFNELHWESLESRRDQSRLIMLYNISKQNIYLPSEYIPEFHRYPVADLGFLKGGFHR